jgi:hypothetical protein
MHNPLYHPLEGYGDKCSLASIYNIPNTSKWPIWGIMVYAPGSALRHDDDHDHHEEHHRGRSSS